MECNTIQEKLSAYIEGVISSEERMLVDEHLKSCQKCNECLADLRKTVEYVNNLKDLEPPVWLTQKVMARIRPEAKFEKCFLQKLFYPLHIKLPLEAVAAILIAVTALYVFKTLQPEVKLAKAPSEDVTPQVLLQEEDTTQKDVKGEGGIFNKSKHAPAKPARQPIPAGKPGTADEYAEATKPPELFLKQDEVVPSAVSPPKNGLKREALSAAPQLKASAERKKDSISLTVNVKDIDTARKEIEKAVMQFTGKITKTESSENREVLTVELGPEKLRKLIEKIKLIGKLKEKEVTVEAREGNIEIKVEIMEKSTER